MAWRIERRIWSGPSACWFLNWALAFCVAPLAAGQSPAPANVADCRPCSFAPGPNLPAYSFTFNLKMAADEKRVDAIEVTSQSDSKLQQRLPVTAMEPLAKDEVFFFGGVDINFDGFLDLMLITRRGVANAYAEYWIFEPKTGRFRELGTYPVFRIDGGKKHLFTYERGGSGGMIHESKEYAFVDAKLTLVSDEKQEATQKPQVFRKVVRQRVDGVMKIVKTEEVRTPR